MGGETNSLLLLEGEEEEEDDLPEKAKLNKRRRREGAVQNTLCLVRFARAILDDTRHMVLPGLEDQDLLKLRVGIHTGECMSGIVGTRNLRFCLFGDTMNVSARMKQKGFAGCIHATQVVADLVFTDFRWEKLEKVEVKGKGLMQTYLLDPQKEEADEMISLRIMSNNNASARGSGLSSSSSKACPRRDIDSSGATRSLPEATVEERTKAFAVELTHSYGKHLRCFSLCFRPLWAERVYLDHHARLYKNATYAAYALSCVSCVGPFLLHSLTQWSEVKICSSPENESVCVDVFAGKIPLQVARSDYMFASFFVYNYRVYFFWVFLSSILINGGGCIVHYLIHRLKCITDKSWATLSAFVFFASQLGVLTLVIDARLIRHDNQRWLEETFHTVAAGDENDRVDINAHESWNDVGYYLFVSYILLFTAYSCISASVFQANLLLWIFGLICYFYVLFEVVSIHTEAMRANVSAIADNALWELFQNIFFLSCIAATYLIGSYCFTVARRKLFLQSVLMRHQTNEIIEQKTINEGLQRATLEKILPRCILKDCKMVQKGDFSKDSLSKRYLGVSVMFCDIVGFTRFSSQVDPATVMAFLNDLFTRFDQLCESFAVYKVETVGDCYVVAVGVVTGVVSTHSVVGEGETNSLLLLEGEEEEEDDLPEKMKLNKRRRREGAVENTLCLVRFARAILEDTRHMVLPGLEDQDLLKLRVGIHTGECISGIVGRTSLRFSLFGEAVDGAEEMEERGSPGFIHVSSHVASLVFTDF